MTVETVTVHVPQALYARFEERARQTRRSVEEELVEALAEAVSLDDDALPFDAVAVLETLDTMPDEALWQVARTSHLSPVAAAHLAELNHKRQREGLTVEERQMAATLRNQYERAMLVRAEAMAKLKERGHDISTFLEPSTT